MTQKSKFTFIDLFAGIGGFHIAMSKIGGKCIYASEWDKAARETYHHNFYSSNKELFDSNNFSGDISKIQPETIPDFDILCGGFPCQPFSHAGFKKGFLDPRGTLFFNVAEIIRIKQPKAFLLENVRHLLKHDEGNTFKTIEHSLRGLGYSFYWKVIKGTDFGIPQHRPRVYIVGFKDSSIKFDFPQPIPLKLTMSDILGGQCTREVGFTLRVGGRGSNINDRRNWDSYIVDGTVIRLTPENAKLMQGFPKEYYFPVTETQAMKQLGNSVVIPAVEAVAEQIIFSLENLEKAKNVA